MGEGVKSLSVDHLDLLGEVDLHQPVPADRAAHAHQPRGQGLRREAGGLQGALARRDFRREAVAAIGEIQLGPASGVAQPPHP
jgi:hypothetical protein